MSKELGASAPAEIVGRVPLEATPARPGATTWRGRGRGPTLRVRRSALPPLLSRIQLRARLRVGVAPVAGRQLDGVHVDLPEQSCSRFIGAAVSRVVETPIEVDWTGPSDLTVTVPAADLRWRMRGASTPVTRSMNLMMSIMPAC